MGNSGDYSLDKTGFFFTAEHTQGFDLGFNKAVLQYATEGYAWQASLVTTLVTHTIWEDLVATTKRVVNRYALSIGV
ncbi:carbohydrate porin [Vibrio taketomensis]|uniref:carbohydrate porin n=1 Tax=Vibrio taketomensis TaxID=2572923 RepID=UPI0022B298F7|nr:carbohydrate porin [Vibrio taketomensis]